MGVFLNKHFSDSGKEININIMIFSKPKPVQMSLEKAHYWVKAEHQQQKNGRGESHVWADNEAEFLLNLTLQYKVNKNTRKYHLTPFVLSVVGKYI